MRLSVDVRELRGQPGSSRRVQLKAPVSGLATELARVPEDRPVDADLLLENVVEGVLVSGPVSGVMVLACARCLTPVEADFRIAVQEMFTEGARPGDDEYPLEEESVDLEPMIRDAVVLSMPFAPLCREGCLGLCERCGGDRNRGECTCAVEADPRWAPLLELRVEEPGEKT